MASIEAKKNLILDYEQRFAAELGLAIIPKPKVSLWMVLIPMYFVFHIYRHKRYVEGRRLFAANFMVSRRGVVEETMEALRQNRPANLDALAASAKLPSEEARRMYREWLTVLMAHYRELLSVQADDFVALVKLAYRNRSNYLLALEQLGEAEKKFNSAMRPHIKSKTDDIDDVIAGIEYHTTQMRRAYAQLVFP